MILISGTVNRGSKIPGQQVIHILDITAVAVDNGICST